MKQLEEHLSTWQPRPPSPRLKERLFQSSAPAKETVGWTRLDLWRGLTTAAACLLLAFVCQHFPENSSAPLPPHLNLPSNVLSGMDSNRPGAATLASTNPPQSPSSMGSFQGLVTNGLTY